MKFGTLKQCLYYQQKAIFHFQDDQSGLACQETDLCDFQENFGGRAASVKLVGKFCINHKWETSTTAKYKQGRKSTMHIGSASAVVNACYKYLSWNM